MSPDTTSRAARSAQRAGLAPSCEAETESAAGNDVESTTPNRSLKDGQRLALGYLRDGCSLLETESRLCEDLGCGEAHARRCVQRAVATMNDTFSAMTPEERLALAVEQRERIVEDALASQELRIALAAMDSRDKLLDLAGADALVTPQTLLALLEQAGAHDPADADESEN